MSGLFRLGVVAAAGVVLIPGAVLAAAPVPGKNSNTQRIADLKQRARSANNLRQILLAIHRYHDANGHFPTDIVDKNGKPLLSWRVALLPYLEQTPLSERIKHDEPWNSENNRKVLRQMPDVFRIGLEPPDETKTYYQGFVGRGAFFAQGQQLKFTNITDGLSNTLAVVEAGPPVEWTRPADIAFDPNKALPKLEGPFSNTLMVATVDGQVHKLRRDLDEKALHPLITIAGDDIADIEELLAKFPLTADELKMLEAIVVENEKTIAAIAEKLRDHQKVMLELAKCPQIKGFDVDQFLQKSEELKRMLDELTEELKEMKELLKNQPPKEPGG